MEYNDVPEEYYDDFEEILDYAYSPEEGPRDDYSDDLPARFLERAGLFKDDELVSIGGTYLTKALVRGEWCDVAAIAGGATPPEHRFRGYQGKLFKEGLTYLKNKGYPFAVLWSYRPSEHSKVGFGLVNKYKMYELDPSSLDFTVKHKSGEFVRVNEDDWKTLNSVYERYCETRDFLFRRNEDWWEELVFDSVGGTPYVYVWKRDGEPRGYIVYTIEVDEETIDRNRNEKTMRVTELAYADDEAYLNLLRFCFNHVRQVDRVVIFAPGQDPLMEWVPEPKEVTCQLYPGASLRIVDVERALTELTYPEDVDESLTIDVEDVLVPSNNDTFALTVSDGEAAIETTEAEPDVETDIKTFSQVCAGYYTPKRASRFGDLSYGDDDARASLSALFPQRDVALLELF